MSTNISATYATSSSVSWVEKGSASVDAATRSVTGKSTGAKPPREPSATLAPRANAAVDDAVGEREVA
jgi:hypothetical protein